MTWLGIYIFGFLVVLYGPILLLPLFAFNDSSVIAFPLRGWTLEWFAAMARAEPLHQATWNSLRVAAATAVISTSLGALAARAVTRHDMPGRLAVLGALLTPIALPEILIGAGLLVTVIAVGLELSLLTIIAGHVLICLPFSVIILRTAFNTLDPGLEAAAIDLGASRWAVLWTITLPLTLPGIIASVLVAFTISFDEFIIAFFLAGPDTTLPVYIWSQLRFPARIPSVMALGTLLLIVSLVLLATAETLRRVSVRRASSATDPSRAYR